MSVPDKQVRDLISRQAADWFIANRAGLLEKQSVEFAAWLQSSPAHIDEYLSIATVSRDLRAACDQPDNSIEQIIARAQSSERVLPLQPYIESDVNKTSASGWPRTAFTLAAVVTTGIGLYLMGEHWLPEMHHPAELTTLHFATRHGEQQTIVLADNSILHLNTDSAAAVRYARSERSVTLTAGEVHLQVAHDARRPFHVLAGPADIVDVGTQFDVRLQQDAALVTVIVGRVVVGLRSDRRASARKMTLEANQQIEVTVASMPASPTFADTQRTTAWLQRKIVFQNESLVNVAEEFSRYSLKPIEILSPPLQPLQISGVFALEDTDAFVAFLRTLDGVRVDVTPTSIRVAQR